MNEIEELLRTTLDDPRRRIDAASAHLDGYRLRARSLHRRRTALASGIAIVAMLTAVVGVFAVSRPRSERSDKTPPAETPVSVSVSPGLLSAQSFGNVPDAIDAQLADGTLWVLGSDGAVHRLAAADGTDHNFGAVPGGVPHGIVAGDGSVWTWATSGSTTVLREFDSSTGRRLRTVTLPTSLSSADVLDGELWLATDAGLYRLRANATRPERVTQEQTFVVVADPDRHRVLFDDGTSLSLVAYDSVASKETIRVPVHLGKISVALTKNGQLWVAGYGASGSQKAVHLEADTLRVLGTTPLAERIGAGASVYPGDAVIWVENNGNNVSCLDASTGQVLTTGLEGNYRVGSIAGFGFRVGAGFGLERLVLPASCPG